MRSPARLALPALLLGIAAPAGGQENGPDEDALAFDRWLVSAPFPASRAEGGSPLAAPGPEGVLPDRGREAAGVEWNLVRRDGASTFRLDAPVAGPGTGTPDDQAPEDRAPDGDRMVYAHAYVRSSGDRTVRLVWRGLDGTRVRAWLNGRPLLDLDGEPREPADSASVRVRLGHGWNTVLLRAIGSEGELGFGARLLPDAATRSPGLEGIRVQASRPPGDIRTGPEPYILVDPQVRTTGRLAWRDEELLGGAAVEVTAWSPTPIDQVRFRLRAGGTETEGTARWLTPGAPVRAELWLPLDRLRRAAEAGSPVETEIRWAEERERQLLLPPDSVPAAREVPIRLVGWEVRESPETDPPDRLGPADEPPASAGWLLDGEWRVPDVLAGRRLTLDVEEAPGDYRVGDRALDGEAGVAVLCDPCSQGQRIEILVRSSADWSAFPAAVRAGGGAAPGGGDR